MGSRTFNINGSSYTITENRCNPRRMKGNYISDPNDPRLVALPASNHQQGHWLMAKALARLRAEADAAGFKFRVASGWRREISDAKYAAIAAKKGVSVKALGNTLAKVGTHHVGLAVDFSLGVIAPTFGTGHARQRQMLVDPGFYWLVMNAYRFGFTPLLGREWATSKKYGKQQWWYHEPWHWEYHVSVDEWKRLPDGSEGLDLVASRAMEYGGAERGSFGAAKVDADTAWAMAEAAKLPPVTGHFYSDPVCTSGSVYNFETGEWS